MLPYHTLPFCLWIKVMDPRLILCHYSVKNSLWFSLQTTCKQLRRSVQTSTQTFFCSSVNILGTQRANTFLIPSFLNLLIQFNSAMCLIVKRLSLFNMSLITWMFSALATSFWRPERCSLRTLFLPRLNWATQFLTALYVGPSSPNLTNISS